MLKSKGFYFWIVGLLIWIGIAIFVRQEIGFLGFHLWLPILGVFCSQHISFRVGVSLTVVLAFFSVVQPVYLSELLDDFNGRIQDSFFQVRGSVKKSGNIVIVDLDQKTLELLKKWPLPRTDITRLVDNLFSNGARVAGFDMVFAEPCANSLKDWAYRLNKLGISFQLPGLSLEESRQKIEDKAWGFFVQHESIQNLFNHYWSAYFQSLDSSFVMDETLDPNAQQNILVNKFIALEKLQYDNNQQKLFDYAQSNGGNYTKLSYEPPQYPVLKMMQISEEFFSLKGSFQDMSIYEKGSDLVIDNDNDLAQAFDRWPVVAGGLFILEENQGSRILNDVENYKETEGMVIDVILDQAPQFFPLIRKGKEQVLNVPCIQHLTRHQGMFNVVPDNTGGARSYTMLMQAPVFQRSLLLKPEFAQAEGDALFDPNNYESKIIQTDFVYFSLALQMFRVAHGYDIVECGRNSSGYPGLFLKRDKGFSYPNMPGSHENRFDIKEFPSLLPQTYFFPLDPKCDIRINYLGEGGPWKTTSPLPPDYYFDYISMADLLTGCVDPKRLKDKYVFIGSSDPTLADLVVTPYGSAFPGVEVHATILENLLHEDYMVSYGAIEKYATFLAILSLGTLISGLVAYTNLLLSSFVLAFFVITLPLSSYFMFSYEHIIFNFYYPWVSLILIYGLGIILNVVIEGKEKRFLKSTFKNYLSPELIDQMLATKQNPNLGGDVGMLTAFFTDIAGFSTFSEVLGSPQKLVELLNEYLSAMTDILLNHGGTLDKYEGDAIIAFFGAPVVLDNNPKSACLTALAMQKKLEELKVKWKGEGDKWPYLVHVMRMRIGINYGKIFTGNMGSAIRMNYTMMGDSVNLAARLEGAGKQYGCFTFCSLETLEAAGPYFIYRKIDRLRVVGKSEPVVVCELLCQKEDSNPELEQLIVLFEKAWTFYADQKWDEALAIFNESLLLEPYHRSKHPDCKTNPSQVFIERCLSYKKTPPVPEGESWDGVFVATNK